MFSLLLAAGRQQEFYSVLAAIFIAIALLFVGFFVFVAQRYKRCPSNRVLVVYGRIGGGNSARCVHGGAAFVIPLIQDYAYLSLEPIQIEVPLRGALSSENIRVNVPSVFTVAIGTSPDVMQNAAVRLLGLKPPEIRKQAEEIIFGQLRQVIASMRIEDINRDRETFLHHIQSSLEPELKKVGLVLINVNITDITDESGYIDAIGQKAASQAIQQARGDVADQERMGETRVAEAERDKAIQVANAHKLRDIGTREAQREQAVRVAELDKEQKVGEQTAGFERDAQVKNAEQLMRISLADADARAIQGENQAHAMVAGSQAQFQVKKAEAYELGEKRKQPCSKPKIAPWRRPRWRMPSASRPNAVPSSRRPPKLKRPRPSWKLKPRPKNAALKPRVRLPPSLQSSTPRRAANTKSWPRKAKASNRSSPRVAAPRRPSK